MLADYLRFLLIAASALIVVFGLINFWRVRKHLVGRQWMFLLAGMCVLVYAADGAREAIQQNLGFRVRLIFYVAGIILYGLYLMQPMRSQKKLLDGKPWIEGRDEE